MPFPYGRIAMSFTTSQAPFSIRNKLSASKSLLALISILSTILSGCQHNIMSGMITERHNIDCRLIMKAISKGSLAGCIVHIDAGSTEHFAQKFFKFLSTLGLYPLGFLMLVYLSEIGLIPVALMLFWLLTY